MFNLIEKGKKVNATNYGAFSKNGFSNDLYNKSFDLITIDDLFDL
jgi:hypothetical protein